jgi:toxin YoeB
MMQITFSRNAWEDYLSWQADDRKMIKKINALIKDIQSTPFLGIGKPEPLKCDLAGLGSRRIDSEHRLVYQVEDDNLLIYSCRYHYSLPGTQ